MPTQSQPKDLERSRVIESAKDSLVEALTILAEELNARFEDPLQFKRFIKSADPDKLLKMMTGIIKALQKPQTSLIIPKSAKVNLTQANLYVQQFANDKTKREELREIARKRIATFPS